MKKYFFWLFLLLFAVAPAAFSAGNSTFEFLRTDVSARAAALGGSFLTMNEDPNILFYNPAGLATISSNRLSVGFFKNLMDINSGHASYATTIGGLGTIGAGVVYTNYGSFQGLDQNGQEIGTFSAGDLAVNAGYAGLLRNDLSYGISAKFIYSSIAGFNASGAAVDLGVRYVAVPERIVFAASLLNLGTEIDPYLTIRENLPTELRVGVMLMPEHLPAAILLDLHDLNNTDLAFGERLREFSIGVEFTSSSNLNLRFGFNNAQRNDLRIGSSSGMAGLSIGGGLKADLYTFDYAFNSLGSIGGLHRVSVSVAF